MSKSREWCRLLDDCFRGKVNLIVTRLLRSVSKDVRETEMVARLLARQDPPIGIYFRSEDIFTLASYFRDDMTEREFLPEGWEVLPEDEIDQALKAGEPDSRRLSEGSE
jgi:predicted ATPase